MGGLGCLVALAAFIAYRFFPGEVVFALAQCAWVSSKRARQFYELFDG